MAFSLSSLLQNTAIQNTSSVAVTKASDGTVNIPADKIMQLNNGDQISGEVTNINGNEVTIKVGPDQYLQAKLSSDMNISLNMQLTFEVQKNANQQIALRALYTNLSVNPTAMKALDMAQLPVTEQSVSMVDAMMREGMNIDKESLQNMFQEIQKNPEASGETIIQLSRLGLMIDKNTISQYESYQNMNHQLTSAYEEITSELKNCITDMASKGRLDESFLLAQKTIDIFAGSDISWVKDLPQIKDEGTAFLDALNKTTNINEKIDANTLSDSTQHLAQETKEVDIQKSDSKISQSKLNLNNTEIKELVELTKNLGVSREVLNGIQNQTILGKQLLALISQLSGRMPEMGSLDEKQALSRLLTSPVFEKLLKNEMNENLTLRPEQGIQKEKISELYDKIQEKTGQLLEVLKESGQTQSQAFMSVTSLNQNLDFMNQLNQMVNYVQLPLKMNEQNTNGELYVYTNKKNLAKNDGNVSAFLHLEMEHLGNVDVYVAMQTGNQVKTNFYLEDDAMIDFIEQNIHILDERLENRGYHMESKVSEREKQFQVMDEIKKSETRTGSINSKIASYAFDVRA